MRKYFSIVYLVLFFSIVFVQAQSGQAVTNKSDADKSKSSAKIAVAAVGNSETSKISDKAGRAPYYLIFDCNGVFIKAIKNPAQGQRGGASSAVANLLVKESVKTVIAGRFGDKMKNILKTYKIEYHEQTGIAKKIVEAMIKNKRSKNAQK